MRKQAERQSWFLVAAGSALLAGMIAQRGLESGWRAIYDDDPPEDPWKADSWMSALGWAALSATVVAAVQLSARHGAQLGWKKVMGHAPPAA
jgi:hypothetical protein